MTEQQHPQNAQNFQNAEQWCQFLIDKQPPVRASIIKRFRRLLTDKHCSIVTLSRFIKADPLLSFYVALTAGRLHSAKNSVITSLNHATSSLGIHKLEQLINRIPTTRLSPESTAQKMYFRAVANSHHAAIQTQQWLLQSRGGQFVEESYQAALFYNIGHWLLWYFAPLQMSKIQVLIREQQLNPELAETRTLGCSIDAISKQLLSHWPIAPLISTTTVTTSPLNKQVIFQLHQRAIGDPRLQSDQLRQLNHLTQQKLFPVKLSNGLTFSSNYSWTSESTLQLIDIINDYLRSQLSQTSAFLHQNCALAARLYHVPGTLAPATEMLLLPSNLSPAYRLTAADKKRFNLTPKNNESLTQLVEQVAAPATDKSSQNRAMLDQKTAATSLFKPTKGEYNRDLFQTYLDKFDTLGNSYTQGTQILTDLLNGLIRGAGLTRVALIIFPPNSDTLQVIKAAGFEDDHPLPHSPHQLTPQSLFHRLHEKPACLLVTEANRQQVNAMLPSSFNTAVSKQSYLLMSLIASNKSVVIIYADREGLPNGVQSLHHQKFKQLCQAAGHCLDQLYTTRAGASL